MEELCGSLPNWMKPTTKEEKILKEGLEKTSENQDNMNGISCLAFRNHTGCPPLGANSKLPSLLAYYRTDSPFYILEKVQEFSYYIESKK